jgi:hypothetical protein
MMADRLFTPRTANRALRALRPTVERLCRLFNDMEQLCPERIHTDQTVEPGYFGLVCKLHDLIQRLMAAGVEVKDLKHGIIDFPARLDGKQVLLCWQVGEPGLAHWHETEAGYSGRKPVDDDGLWESDSSEGSAIPPIDLP